MLTRLRHLLIEALQWFDAKSLRGDALIDAMQKWQGNRPRVRPR